MLSKGLLAWCGSDPCTLPSKTKGKEDVQNTGLKEGHSKDDLVSRRKDIKLTQELMKQPPYTDVELTPWSSLHGK